MSHPSSLIRSQGLTKTYALGQIDVPALRGIDFTIETGEFIAIWGPSGSGKTTLLNLIGLIDEPSSGSLFFRGKDICTLSDDARSEMRNGSIGFIFQRFNLIPVLSALENVMLPLQIQGVKAGVALKTSMERLDQMGLAAFVNNRPDKLSGGQQQRVSIARALVTNPSLVIADEPTANLDSDNAMRILDLMRTLNRQEKTSFIFSTHDQRLLKNVNRLIRLEDGLIVEDAERGNLA